MLKKTKKYSHAKYETNIKLRNEKQIGSKRLLACKAKWSHGKEQVAGVSFLQAIEFYFKTREINRIQSEEGRKSV